MDLNDAKAEIEAADLYIEELEAENKDLQEIAKKLVLEISRLKADALGPRFLWHRLVKAVRGE